MRNRRDKAGNALRALDEVFKIESRSPARRLDRKAYRQAGGDSAGSPIKRAARFRSGRAQPAEYAIGLEVGKLGAAPAAAALNGCPE